MSSSLTTRLLSENLGTHRREWPAEKNKQTNNNKKKNSAEVHMLVEANSKPHDIVIYTDGSVTRDRSGYRVSAGTGRPGVSIP